MVAATSRGAPCGAQAASAQSEQAIGRCFELRVLAQPGRLAISSDSGDLSYSQLNALADSRAEALRQLELRPQESVATLLDQGPGFIAALLGILKAGGCFVPLDPANPAGRNLQMLEDTGARVLVTSAEHLAMAETLAAGGCRVPIFQPRAASTADSAGPRPAWYAISSSSLTPN